MTALAIPDVELLDAGANTDLADYMTALYNYFNATSTKYSIVVNGGSAAAFTITPVDPNETWHLNFRYISATLVKICLDPLGNITDPGDSVTPPTLTDSSEWSEECDCWQFAGGGAEDPEFYVVELDDCVFVLHMNDTTRTHIPYAIMCGRTWIPYNSDGVNGDNYADGLGIHGSIPNAFTSFNTDTWFSQNTTTSRIRMAQTGGYTPGDPTAAWYNCGVTARPSTSQVGRIKGAEKLSSAVVYALMTDGSATTYIGFTKYVKFHGVANQSPGKRRDGIDGDEWINIREVTTPDNQLIPWKPNLTPVFS